MRIPALLACSAWLWAAASATILQNGQVKDDPYPGQAPVLELDDSWRTYDAGAEEIAYKGRWDSQHISWWTAPGLKVQFSGEKLAISFGPSTSNGVLIAYRIGSLDWLFSNVTADTTYQFVGPGTAYDITTDLGDEKVFEMRVQIAGVSVSNEDTLTPPPVFPRKVEIIGGSLAAGQFASYETLSGWAWLFVESLGNVESTLTAYPGACLANFHCYDNNVPGMPWYWHRASDPGARSHETYGEDIPLYDNRATQPADLVVIQMGGNDFRAPNEIPGHIFEHDYIQLINDIHRTWRNAIVVVMSQWGEFLQNGTAYTPTREYDSEIRRVHEHFRDAGFVHFFDTDGLLAHNDIGPQYHPTDIGHVKIAASLVQWVRLILRWKTGPTGEVQHGGVYWNDQQEY